MELPCLPADSWAYQIQRSGTCSCSRPAGLGVPPHVPPACPAPLQIAGHVISEDGKKRVALKGKWNSFLDMTRCDEEGEPLAGAETVRLWEVSACWGTLQL